MRRLLAALALTAIFTSPSAQAAIVESGPGAVLLRYEAVAPATPDQAYRALGQLPRWWNVEHSYSGDARRMSFDLRAGGCLCERWGGNSVEHARVLLVLAHGGGHTVRLAGALGPLQEMGVTGIMTFTIAPDPQGAKIVMTYRVSGEPGLALQNIAAPVDGVLQEQFDRFIRYTAN
jgi:hypothetical protein